MKTLTIKDLAHTEQLERNAMAGVRGGWSMGSPSYLPSYTMGDLNYAPSTDSSITAAQSLFQKQSVMTATANGAAFVHGLDARSDVHQDAQNKIIG